jgi:uncharacterized membrane protein
MELIEERDRSDHGPGMQGRALQGRGMQGREQERHRSLPARNLASREALRQTPIEKRAAGLGWFSIGLGLAQLCAPRQMARLIGIDDEDEGARLGLMAVGLRELTCGLGLLSGTHPAAWAWARTAGDVMDLALLGYAWKDRDVSNERMLSVGSSVVGCALVDAQTALQLQRNGAGLDGTGIHVRQGITVQKTPDEVYAFFRQLENLPRFMAHLESVSETSNGRSRWTALGPLGTHVEWEAELREDRPGECIAWQSVDGADVPNSGRVSFRPAPGNLGTELVVELDYMPPSGAIGAAVARLFGKEPAQQISADLRRLKQVLETGEVLHSNASVHRGMHPARPSRLAATSAKQVQS